MPQKFFRNISITVSASTAFATVFVENAVAGMPSTLVVLTEQGTDRLIGLSTALFVVLVLAAIPVLFCWNYLVGQTDGETAVLKRLNYPKALGVTFLGICLFSMVLVMVAGSRELFSPGAWIPDGQLSKTVYNAQREKLAQSLRTTDDGENLDLMRRSAILKLRDALRLYAKTHDGKLPDSVEESKLGDLWQIPFAAGVLYEYFPNDKEKPLVREPALLPDARFSMNHAFDVTEAAQ